MEMGDTNRVVLGGWRELFTSIWMIVCLHLTQTWYSEMAPFSWKIGRTGALFQIHGCCKIPLSLSLYFGLQSLTDTGTKQNVSYWLAEEWFDSCLVVCSNASSRSRLFFFVFKLSKVTLSQFLEGRMLPSQMQRYCRNQCWCHRAPTEVQQGVQRCLKFFLLICVLIHSKATFSYFLASSSLDKRECRETHQFCLLELLLRRKEVKWMWRACFLVVPVLIFWVAFLWRL